LLGKRRRAGLQGDIDDVDAFFKNDTIEEVPEEDLSKKKRGPDDLPEGYSSMDSDEIAETRALAKKMLRKKFRTETIDASYSKYAHEENDDIMPQWFLEDEAKHNRPNINLTQDEIDEEKR
jgi:AdoMet-dependent rRNA methyltransferase SPB1